MYSLKLAYINRFFWPVIKIIFVFKLGFFLCFLHMQFFSQFGKQCWIIYGWHVNVNLYIDFHLQCPYEHWKLMMHILYVQLSNTVEESQMKLVANDHCFHTHELLPNPLHVSNKNSVKFKHSRYAQLRYLHDWKL